MKAIKVSDTLYSDAQSEAAMMSRSIAQQLEHWANLGRMLEACDVTPDQVRRMLARDPRMRERVLAATGAIEPRSASFIPREWARQATVTWPPDSALDAR